MNNLFVPKFFTMIKEGISRQQLSRDITSGVIVGIVALPLAIAFAIASGVTPNKGLVTAVIAGFIIAAFGGSRVQIGGPTGAFIVVVYGIVQKFGVEGLILATFMAGFFLMAMGFARLGNYIKFVPHSLVVGFTSGIAIIIFSSQIKDFFGMTIDNLPADFIGKWTGYFHHLAGINGYASGIALGTIIITLLMPKINDRIPGSLLAIIIFTLLAQWLKWPVDTIETRFGSIPSTLPFPKFPDLHLSNVTELIQPAFTIAILGAIESLLCAVVADGMVGGRHRSNMELIAQGGANIFSAMFGGIPATGAIARTATNVKNGGRTPVAGIVHAVTLLLIMLFVGRWAKLIPLSCLAGILVVVAYNMSEWRSFLSILRGPRADIAILVITFMLTVIVDLTFAIEVGMVLSAFLFMSRMAKISNLRVINDEINDVNLDREDPDSNIKLAIPEEVLVYEVNGPLFFGAANIFKEAMEVLQQHPKVMILRMRQVPIIDATGIHNLKSFLKGISGKTKIVLSGVQPEVFNELSKARIIFSVGKKNVCPNIHEALKRASEILTATINMTSYK